MATREQVEAVERLVHESVQRVDAIAPDALRRMLPALREARDELRAELSALWSRDGGFERFTAYQRAQTLRALEATFERIEQIQPAMAGVLGIGRKETGTLAVKNLEHEVQRLSSLFGGGTVALPQIDTAAVIAEGSRMLIKRHAASAARYAGSIGDDVRHRLAVSLAKGDTFEQQVQRLRGSAQFRSMVARNDPAAAAHGVSDAMFNRWRHWADRLVRTENMHAYNVQHDLSIEHVNENRSEDDDEYLRRWDASADKVTCDLCKELDRTLATIDGTFKGGIKSPPRHPYCRCVVLAWLARWGHFKGEAPSKDAEGKDIAPKKDLPRQSKPTTEQSEPATERKNPKRVAAAKKAADASAERRREIHSAVKSNLPQELHVAWETEGHKFMRQEGARIRGEKDRISAASKLSEAFAEQYGSGQETAHGNEGDRFQRRAEIEAKHAEAWADEQERKYYERARKESLDSDKAKRDEHDTWGTKPKDDDDPPF